MFTARGRGLARFSHRAPGARYRNHCLVCLCSRHLDVEPGDRAAERGGADRHRAQARW
ncbi:MAG: RNHCP domain-containing protein [Gemmatimonadales bacterium]